MVKKIRVKRKEGLLKGFRKRTFFQKTWGDFSPTMYEGNTAEERRRLAYEDAKQHADLYKELVKEGIYPEGTKIKVKRKRHSDSYTIGFFMPKITPLIKDLFRKYREEDIPKISDKIIQIATNHGYRGWEHGGWRGGFHSDILKIREEEWKRYRNQGINDPIQHYRNYGIDQKGKLRYLDVDVLMGHLPFERRKSNQKKTLEGRVIVSILSLIGGIALSILSLTATGNVISNLTGTTQGLLGIFLFIVGLVRILLHFNQKRL